MMLMSPIQKDDVPFEERPRARDTVRIPRIRIHAFCESEEAASSIEAAVRDRFMARAHSTVQKGGIPAATAFYEQTQTPSLLIIESSAANDIFLTQLDRLADVCDPGTKVVAVGHTNDIAFYRELIRRGVSEYLLAPVEPEQLINAISALYSDANTGKLGRTCAFIGSKGGVGSSTIAHNVGWTLSRRLNLDLILADLDLPFGTAGLDFNLDSTSGVADAIQDAGRLDEVLLERLLTRCGDHFSILSAPVSLDRSYDLEEKTFEKLMEVAQSSVPFTILDMPHQWTSWTRHILRGVDEIVVTATPDLASLRNAKNLIEGLKEARPHDAPPKLILNQVGVPKRPEIKVKDFAKTVKLEPVACIPFDAHAFGTAANKGQMVAEASPRAAACKAFSTIADEMTGRLPSKGAQKGVFGSLFGKLKQR
jgi:pilus assembly protein CpaE